MTDVRIFHAGRSKVVGHAGGIRTTPLMAPVRGAGWLCGISVYPVGVAAPAHRHNCNEQIIVLEGTAQLCVGDQVWALGPNDCGWIPAGLDHAYRNTGGGDLRLLWLYDSSEATRTTSEDGVTVAMLAPGRA